DGERAPKIPRCCQEDHSGNQWSHRDRHSEWWRSRGGARGGGCGHRVQDDRGAEGARCQWHSRHARGAPDAMSETIARTGWRYTGALSGLSKDERASVMVRSAARSSTVRGETEDIVRRVRTDGDRALREMSRIYD